MTSTKVQQKIIIAMSKRPTASICKSGQIGNGRDRDVNECDEDQCGTNQNCMSAT